MEPRREGDGGGGGFKPETSAGLNARRHEDIIWPGAMEEGQSCRMARGPSAGSGEMLISWEAASRFSVKKQELRCLSSGGLRWPSRQLALHSAPCAPSQEDWSESRPQTLLQPLPQGSQRGSAPSTPRSVLSQQEGVFGKAAQKPRLGSRNGDGPLCS